MSAPRRISGKELLLFAMAVVAGGFLAVKDWNVVFVSGQVIPLGYDSFYHLSRILEIAANPATIAEFDARLHWPDGMWIPWPWAYDYGIGLLAGLFSDSARGAARLAVFAPVVLLVLNLAVFGLVARRLLRPPMAAFALLVYAVAPLTFALHKVGNIDHHVAEHSAMLLALYLMLRWYDDLSRPGPALLLGALLGAATSIHNGLFILQVPVLLTLLGTRLAGQPGPTTRSAAGFSIALAGAQLAVLLPSHHFWNFTYEFYYLSWFHLHISGLTAVAMMALARPSLPRMWMLLGLGVVLSVPALPRTLHGMGFIGGRFAELQAIAESHSPYSGHHPARIVTGLQSGLIWLMPLLAAWSAFRLVKSQWNKPESVLLVFALFGFVLMALQIRFHYFGSAQLLLVTFLVLQTLFSAPRDLVYTAIVIVGAFSQSLTNYAIRPEIGQSPRYSPGYPLINAFIPACKEQPGLLLADRNWVNFLRYHTECSFLANNFIMTDRDFAAIQRTDRLLDMTPEQLLREAPEIQYVLASRLEDNRLGRVLVGDFGHPRFERLFQVRNHQGEVYGRAYRVLPLSTTENR